MEGGQDMLRKWFIVFCALLFALTWNTGTSVAQSTSPDGLQLSNFKVTPMQAKVGDQVQVSFVLTNTTAHPITISPESGVFVGARWNSTTDANNRDFSHRDRGRFLKPGDKVKMEATKKLDAAGTWRFWPAYKVNGHWGPFRWNEIVVEVAEATTGTPRRDDGVCPVHGVRMEPINLRVIYGMPSQKEFLEMRAGKSLFPYGRDYVLGGCVVKPEKFRKGFLCPECVKARNAWIASQKHGDKISRASQASLEEFFAIVNSRDVDGAMKSMAPGMLKTPEQREAWRRQLAAFRSIHVIDVEPANVNDWSSTRHIFRVTLEAYVKEEPGAPIPFFGWHDNPNVRWITMELNNNHRWVVAGIATGP
jgi:hypothetical protein